MDRDQMSEGSTPSANDDTFPLKRTISTSNSDPRLSPGLASARTDAAPLEHNYLDTDTNDSKRRKIQDHSDTTLGQTQTQTMDASNSVAGIHHGNTAVRSTREYSFSDVQQDPRTATAATTITAITTTTALSIERPPLDAHEFESGPRTLEPRRSVKRVNYADPEDSIEEDEDDQILQEDTLSSRRRTQSRTSLRSRPPPKQNASEDEGDDDEHSDKSGQGKPEQDSAAFGPRTLRDRRSITAPKPFPIGNPNPPASRIRRPDGGRRTGRRHFEEPDNVYRSSSRSLAPKRPPPTPRQITENMRITRGMSGSLMDSPNSRDVTPDRPSRQNGRSGSRFHHGISSDEEQDLDGDGRRDEDEEDDDEEMEEGEADIEVASSLNNQEDNGLIRMTRLRARNQAQPAISSIHSSQRSSRPKSTHSRSQQEADRKYDLRERPKNRPTYIADRPIPSPTRPRTSRMSSYGGRDPFSRPRQNRPSLFDALRRARVSSSDEHDIPTFKRRSGTAESRGSSSRILPMNMHELADSRRDVIASRVGQLADTDPLAVGNSVDFDKVGGLDHHVKSLKEMVILPLLYPEVYSHFQMMPPRGVLFHGPPGTGKTLLARALASSCSTETQKVAFFMRKGADCLSKWVGEAERQLRLLFEEARAWQPSIIFFDEIDGLCPVRSSKQEQIHASIVSTMLALMDGLDGRGQVIVIGATNRIDAIDPALRRPGRFDREFYFPLPNEAARRAIIDINTNGWVPALDEGFKNELARITTRYCGADIKALCTEAALKAIRRRYPQIYESNEKLQIDASTIVVEEIDLLKSAKSLTPASYRVTGATASPLPINIAPLLKDQFSSVCKAVDGLFSGASKHPSRGNSHDNDDDTAFQAMGYRSFEKLKTFRPRMLIAGERGMGQRYIGPALLHYLEGCTVQQFDLAALMSESSRTPEAACVQFFIEVKRHAPSIIYIPHIDAWWSVVSEAVKATFSNLLDDLNPEDGILFLATSETPLEALPIPIRRWFLSSPKSRVGMSKPSASSRTLFFEPLLSDLARPPTDFKVRNVEPAQLEQLKKAPPPQPRVPTTEEKKLLREHDEYVLRELRISLRTVVDELFKERKFKPFFRPVEPEEFPDYYDIVKKPMDLTTVSDKINDFMYLDVKEFLSDIDLIADNTRLYNDIHDPSRIIYRARDLQDVAHAMISRLDPELIIETEKTAARRRQEARAHQRPQGERMSRRRLGLEAPAVPDDPEMYLRNRAVMSKLLLDATVREDSADISVKVEGGQTVEDYEQPSNMAEDLNDGSRYHDGEESGTSLSMPPSVAASVAASSIPPTPTVSVTPGPLPTSSNLEVVSLNGKMDVDSPRQSQEGPEVAMSNGAEAPSSYTEDYVDDGKEASMSISPAATSLVAAVDAAATSADVTDTKELTDGTLTSLGKDEHQPVQEDALDIQEETKVAEDEEPMEIVLEQHDVAGLQAVLIQDTEGSSVEELDQLRAALYEIIWEHRHEWDKSAMLSDMRETLAFMTVLRMESEQGSDLHPEHHFD